MGKFPIEHVVIIIKENHTFDNYFGTFPGVNGVSNLPQAPDIMVMDPPHDHKDWLSRDKTVVKLQYNQKDIPKYFSYAKNFTLCDNYFTDVAGPSTPNHLMLITATSPIVDNLNISNFFQPFPPYNLPSLPQQLRNAGHEWKNYGDLAFRLIRNTFLDSRNVSASQFAADASAGNLPQVSWVYAASGFTEHPTESVSKGEKWTVDQINAVIKGKLWDSTAIFVTWDDYGGWYDHVDPPFQEKWKDGTQFRYGSRVPCLVIGPYAKKGHISKDFLSHVSILKFCETVFGLPSLNNRTATTEDMMECFDFTQKPLPPLVL
jgi:phospholipase C